MKGACSNQIIKCIVYTNDFEVGKKKLLEIESEKNALGITTTSKNPFEICFSDEEEWKIVTPTDTGRGYRWRKAWIDVKVSIEMLQNLILPCGALYKRENEKYFNWNVYE